MEKLILVLFATIIFTSCNSSKKQDRVSLAEKSSIVSLHNGSFFGEILDKQNKRNATKITISSDTNSYTFSSQDMEFKGTFTWVNESGKIIELKGLAENYPNKFLVTQGAIIQMLNGSTLQDVEGNNQFVLAMQ